MNVLQADRLTKIYGSRSKVVTKALDNFSLVVKEGEFVGIMGPSGSGKTTLLNLLATLDKPTSGTVTIDGVETAKLRGDKLARFRRERLGFIFQDFNLLDTLTIGENVALPLVLARQSPTFIQERLANVADRLGINAILTKYPYEVSGGQQQRAAAARAIIHDPAILLADEPTGNLDSRSARTLMETLALLNEEAGVTIALVTHDAFAASYCRRILFIRDGRLYNELHKGAGRQVFFQQILDVLALIGGGDDESEAIRS